MTYFEALLYWNRRYDKNNITTTSNIQIPTFLENWCTLYFRLLQYPYEPFRVPSPSKPYIDGDGVVGFVYRLT